MAEFKCRTIKGTEWLDKAIDKLKDDIKKYNLGRDYLSDGAKYLRRGFERYREEKWNYTYKPLFNPIAERQKWFMFDDNGLISISSYVSDYFYYCIEKHDEDKVKGDPLPPLDYLWELETVSSTKASEFYGLMMEIIDSITTIIHNKTIEREGDLFHEDLTDEQPETFEDKYYETVRALYYTYCV